jgi:hypothetical protein
VGVLLDGPRIERWQLVCLSEIEVASFCDLTVFLSGSAPEGARPARAARNFLYHAYERADRRRFAGDDDPLAPVELGEGFKGRIAAGVVPDDLDVLICLGGADGAKLASCARHGVWCLSMGDARAHRHEAPLFWETFMGDALSVTTLWALEGDDGGRAIYRSFAHTDPVSVHRNRLVSYRTAAQLPLRCLRYLHQGDDSPIATAAPDVERPLERRAKPTNGQMVRFLWRLGRRVLRHRLRELLYEEQWYVGYRRREPEPATAATFTTIAPPRGRYYADPFLLERGGRHLLFFEEYVHSTRRGLISHVEIDDEGRCSAPRVALERDYHLSYPFLHGEGGDVYLVPEAGERGRVEVYRASRFPGEWELERVLLEGIEARDPTILRHRGKYWLFAAVADGIWLDELYVFFSDSLLGEWTPHPLNPVVSDVRCARPAGRIFEHAGQLIRPAQDGSEVYGRRIVLNRIERLDETGYREVPVGRIEPVGPEGSLRTHCYTADGRYEAVDGFRLRPRIPLPGRGEPRREQRFRIELES